ncbi:hypothetical protein IQ265_13815 [Nodosilinea sp. LEGE 06152]|uniref:hypothetical protein n=1 Tax=Nodosilinea sp. LEGE 06152 TaxID=2777966 RepID=UPI001880E9BE|nr:hypothetical protein [Nodosilinea sp. LEGE 06152]MBE9157893.1 hypothetical protein [Nodosilinea sp. LEGE 06152]
MDFLQALNKLKTSLPEGTDTTQLDALQQALQPYQGLDPVAARAAIDAQNQRSATDAQLKQTQTERDDFKTQLQQMQAGNAQLSKELAATRGLTAAGVRPQYEELLLGKVTSSIELAEDGTPKTPEGFWDGLKTKYPDMFHAEDGAGTGATPGDTAADTSPRTVQATNGIVSGVNPTDVLNGSVTVQR